MAAPASLPVQGGRRPEQVCLAGGCRGPVSTRLKNSRARKLRFGPGARREAWACKQLEMLMQLRRLGLCEPCFALPRFLIALKNCWRTAGCSGGSLGRLRPSNGPGGLGAAPPGGQGPAQGHQGVRQSRSSWPRCPGPHLPPPLLRRLGAGSAGARHPAASVRSQQMAASTRQGEVRVAAASHFNFLQCADTTWQSVPRSADGPTQVDR